jgi:XTP/dITP diphosphohydrolase
MDLLIGTTNQGKLREYGEIFDGVAKLRLLNLKDVGLDTLDPDEPFETIAENAILKAKIYARESGLIALGDDSGLEVDALDGRPGVYSARYAGEGASDADRRDKLLGEMANIPDDQRGARFVCVAALAHPDGTLETAEGEIRGKIAHAAGELLHGFGYDPIFIPEGFERVFSEIPPQEKHHISHRGRAAQAILPTIMAWAERYT